MEIQHRVHLHRRERADHRPQEEATAHCTLHAGGVGCRAARHRRREREMAGGRRPVPALTSVAGLVLGYTDKINGSALIIIARNHPWKSLKPMCYHPLKRDQVHHCASPANCQLPTRGQRQRPEASRQQQQAEASAWFY
jgi:hypothetical protein